jgi:hypothetical protein
VGKRLHHEASLLESLADTVRGGDGEISVQRDNRFYILIYRQITDQAEGNAGASKCLNQSGEIMGAASDAGEEFGF